MIEIILFGGTTEGRELADFLAAENIPALVSVATHYGETLIHSRGSVRVRQGRLSLPGMIQLLQETKPRCVLDATHPYATEVSRNIQAACQAARVRCITLQREASSLTDALCFPHLEEMIHWLDRTPGTVFSALGSNHAPRLASVKDFDKRIWLRILPTVESVQTCLDAGFPAAHLICMQGPFSLALNTALFQASQASILLTKDSGATGGFEEKIQAARTCQMTVAVLTRPGRADGLTLAQIQAQIKAKII